MIARRLALLALLLSCAAASFAAFPQLATQPANPLPGTPVTIAVGWLCPTYAFSRVNGHVIELTTISAVCVSAQVPGQQFFNVGPLEAGTYEVRVVDQNNFLLGTFQVLALPAGVPALDARSMWLLALVILALGVFGIGRATT
ncbi:MAG TPA: hypothetical protein VGR02_10550 [Thermoanaerobaculia bacterium]|jgi:hypothetical protein|nr:hypothetical protein [Thermoanaerobaculia bacterium]